MAFPVTLNGTTYTLADFEGLNYVDGFPAALEDFVTDAGTKVTAAQTAQTAAQTAQAAAEAALDSFDDRFLGSKTSNPTVDNDGNALTDGALYFDTTNNVMKVYDLGNTEWKQTTPTTSQQANIDTVAGISANVTTVATNNANVTTVATNIVNVNAFAEVYRIASSAPSSSLDEGDLYYDTTDNKVQVYNGSAWQDVAPTATSITASQISDVTSTAAELNLLDGVSATTAELNLLDGVSATTAQINHLDGVTSNIQTQIDSLGSGVVSYTAAEAIAAGDVVAFASTGKVEKISGLVQSASPFQADEYTVFDSDARNVEENRETPMVTIPDTDRVIYFYTESNVIYAQIFSVSVKTVTAVGSAQTVASVNASDIYVAWDESTTDKFVLVYQDNSNNDGYYVVGTLSTDTLSFSTPVNMSTALSVTRGEENYVTYDNGQNAFLFSFRDQASNGYLVAATRSGNTLTFGTKLEHETGEARKPALVYDSSLGKHILTYINSQVLTAKLITVSGTTVSVTATDTDNSITYYYSGSMASNRIACGNDGRVVALYDGSSSTIGILITATSSAITIQSTVQPTGPGGGNIYIVNDGGAIDYMEFASTGGIAGAFGFFSHCNNDSKSQFGYFYESSSNTLAWTGTQRIAPENQNGSQFSENLLGGVGLSYVPSEGSFVFVGVFDDSSQGTDDHTAGALKLEANTTNISKFAGIAAESVSADSTGRFTVISGINDQQSGLNAGSFHYVNGSGVITTTSTDYPLGFAKSATEIHVGASAVDYVASGTWSKLATVTASSASNVDIFANTANYKFIKFIIEDLKFSSAAEIKVRIINSSNTVITSSVYGYSGSYHRSSSQGNVSSNGADSWRVSLHQTPEHSFAGHIRFGAVPSGKKTVGDVLIGSGTSTRDAMHFKTGLATNNTDQLGGIRIFTSNSSTLTGTVKMYGLR